MRLARTWRGCPGIEIDENTVVSSTGALGLAKVPKKMLVIGAGVIGLELGSVWRRLGSQVQVVEFLDRILPGMDLDVARTTQRILTKQGMSFKLDSKVTRVARNGAGHVVTIEPAEGGDAETVEADVVLVSIGRVPYTEGLGLERSGVTLDNRKRVAVDAHYQTNVPGIYALGDVIAGPMLAHKAEDEGMAVAEILAGQAGHVNYDVIPNVIYTFPEVASVGKGEEDLKSAGIEYKVGKFPLTANGRAKVNKTTDGFVKVLADAKTDRILGVHIIAAAGERNDRRGSRHHGIRRFSGRSGAHLSRAPDPDGSHEGSGALSRQARDPYVARSVPRVSASALASRHGSRRSRAASCGRASRPRRTSPAGDTAGTWNRRGLHRAPALPTDTYRGR